MSEYIALVDCDSFFCSCEQKLNPELKNKAVCVVSGERGCIIARTKEAKQMGIKMGMPLFQAIEQFPKCIYINANHYNYITISKQVMDILKEISPNVEVYSIDEAFVDLTGLSKLYKMNYYKLAKHIQKRIKLEVDIPVSIGVSRSKTLSKLASDRAKKTQEHIVVIGEKHIPKYLKNVSVDEIWGIGRRLNIRMAKYGIRTALEFVKKEDKWVDMVLGKNGLFTKHELLGQSVLKVTDIVELPKSISDSKSFLEFTTDLNYLKNELMVHIHSVCKKLRQIDCKCSTIGVILKTKDFKVYFDKINIDIPTNFEFEISEVAFNILENLYRPNTLHRSVGILVEDFNRTGEEQLSLFGNIEKSQKMEKLGKALDNLENKFGRNIVRTGFTHKKVDIKQDFLTHPKF